MAENGEVAERALQQLELHDLRGNRAELAPLLTTAIAATATKDPRFAEAIDRIVGRLRTGEPGRTSDLAFAWRLTSVTAMREHRRRLAGALSQGISMFAELPSIMADPDDRRHFGDAMLHVTAPWTPDYLARAIAEERDGEKAREALSRALVARKPDLAAILELIGPHVVALRFDQSEPANGRARRIAAVLDALGSAVWAADAEVAPGEAFGAALKGLVASALARRPAGDRAAAVLAARSVLDFLITAVRLHGTLAADAETYSCLEPLRRSLGGTGWPDELAPALSRAAGQVLDQLVFLVRLDMPDAKLRLVYLVLMGEGLGRARLAKAADDEALGDEARHWLRTGTARRRLRSQAAVEETAVAAVDRDLALALRDAELVVSDLAVLGPEMRAAAEFSGPRVAQDVVALLGRIDRLAAHVTAAARRRDLVLRGTPGDVVAFSPLEHEPSEEAIGARTVRLLNRIVERASDGRSLGVIVKGDVGQI